MRILTGLYLVLVAIIVVLANVNQLGILGWVHKVPMGDKLMHFLILAGVCFAINSLLRLRKVSVLGIPVFLGTLIVLAIATGEEFSQMWIPSRTFSWLDMLANWLGILCMDRFLAMRERRASNPTSPSPAEATS